MNSKRPQIVLPPDVFSTYHFATLVYKGIGGGAYSVGIPPAQQPYCQAGFRDFLCGYFYLGGNLPPRYIQQLALEQYGITVALNDDIVAAVNKRKGRTNLDARISWEEYCAEGNIICGEEVSDAVAA